MKPKILLTGKNGQVGRELNVLLPDLGEVVALSRSDLDLSRPDDIRHAIRAVRPDILVNGAAYTAVDLAESNEATALCVNAEAPGIMAQECRKIGALLVHYSTDYVFDGSKRAPYVEEDSPNPQNVYGRTKLAGEQAIQRSGATHLIFRTAWVYAQEGRNFLLTILKLATQRGELRIVTDQIGAPTASQEIAAATSQILTQICARDALRAPLPSTSGIYHMTAAGETNWCDFARAILDEADRVKPTSSWFAAATDGRPLIARRVVPITTDEYPTPARRPAYSVLSNASLTRVFGVQLRDWRTELRLTFQKRA